ncbi:cation diffusion facilitator family transporter [Carnobacterium pleistocenium]|uniref:cation diffusion facilitator family transporter n=1 Tax=Carnobacterium pleistocenium TaxID=181073 RepID=UPI000A8C0302|nr:cation diffusion facilitator family transporter [Carnobacterium pleistocenium]
MNQYTVRGLHCANCAKNMEARLQQLKNGETIRLNYSTSHLYLPEEIDMQAVKRILLSDEVQIVEVTQNDGESVFKSEHAHDHLEKGITKKKHHHAQEHDFTGSSKAVKNIKIVFILNLTFSIAEFILGALFNSAAILSDAVHDLGDSLSIGLALFFQKISTKEANERYSFGHRRFSLLGALITSVILIAGSILVIMNSIPLLVDPQPVNANGMFWLSIVAIGINGYAAWLISRGTSKNEKVLNLHMLEDVLGWIGILIVSIVLNFTDWFILDPILSLVIASYILSKAIPGLLENAAIFLEAVPKGVDIKALENNVKLIDSVHAVSHFHMWSIDGEENAVAITIYVNTEDTKQQEQVKEEIRYLIKDANVTHSTIEIVVDKEFFIQ